MVEDKIVIDQKIAGGASDVKPRPQFLRDSRSRAIERYKERAETVYRARTEASAQKKE